MGEDFLNAIKSYWCQVSEAKWPELCFFSLAHLCSCEE